MPIGLQQLQDFSSVSSVSQLKIDDAGNLSRRSGVGTFFQKVADAFRSLSQNGRAEILSRNTRIAEALGRAVQEANAEPPAGENVPALRQMLGDVKNRISAAVQQMRQQASPEELMAGLKADMRFKALPENSRRAILTSLAMVQARTPGELLERMDATTSVFFNHEFKGANMEEGLQTLKDDLINDFLKPSQQNNVKEDGFHDSFRKDTFRGNLRNIGHVDAHGGQDAAVYKNALRNLLGEENARFLPFVSMMASQAGFDSSAVFLPLHSGNDVMQMPEMSLSQDMNHLSSITREGNDILMKLDFDTHYTAALPGGGIPDVLASEGTVTMRIHLDAEPIVENVGGKEVFIPQFDLENAAMNYFVPEA